MRVGILTYDASINYGAHLQAYALYSYFRNHKYGGGYLRPVIIRWGAHYIDTLGYENDPLKPFRDEYFPRTDVCFAEHDLQNVLKSLDVVVVGGDQVFRNWHHDKDLQLQQYLLRYYGDFVKGDVLLLSYAASFGIEYFYGDDVIRAAVAKLLKRFDSISVREKSGVDILQREFGIEHGKEVLDPVFLLSSKDYEDLISKKDTMDCKKPYIAYMVLDNKLGLGDIPQEFLDKFHDYNIININSNQGQYNSVEQWLDYIRQADFVITDSFHCVAFSIIFKKPFIVIKRDFGGNSRLENILKKFTLTQCARNNLDDICIDDLKLTINYDLVYELLDEEKKNSFAYLDVALRQKPKYKEEFLHDDKILKIRQDLELIYTDRMSHHLEVKKQELEKEKKEQKKQFLENIFSVKNTYINNRKYKVVCVFGFKMKIKSIFS